MTQQRINYGPLRRIHLSENVVCRIIVTAERNVKNIVFALRFARPEANVALLEESIKPTPWIFPTFKNITDRIRDVFRFTFRRINGKNEIRCYHRRQIVNGKRKRGKERKDATKTTIAIIALR